MSARDVDPQRLEGHQHVFRGGASREAILEARNAVIELLRDAGVQNLHDLDLPDTAPVVPGRVERWREGPERALRVAGADAAAFAGVSLPSDFRTDKQASRFVSAGDVLPRCAVARCRSHGR